VRVAFMIGSFSSCVELGLERQRGGATLVALTQGK